MAWLEIRQPASSPEANVDLDIGERDAIALAEEVRADLLLIDEWDGRLEARRNGLINIEKAFVRLRGTNFRASPELLEALLKEYRRG